MAFDDAALERALRAETKHGLTLYCNGEIVGVVPPRLSPARGHGQRGDATKVAASGDDELVRLERAGGMRQSLRPLRGHLPLHKGG